MRHQEHVCHGPVRVTKIYCLPEASAWSCVFDLSDGSRGVVPEPHAPNETYPEITTC